MDALQQLDANGVVVLNPPKSIETAVDLEFLKLMHDGRQLLIRNFQAGLIEVVINDTLLNQLLENIRANLQTELIRQRGKLRVGLNLVTVGILKLANADVDTIDFSGVA